MVRGKWVSSPPLTGWKQQFRRASARACSIVQVDELSVYRWNNAVIRSRAGTSINIAEIRQKPRSKRPSMKAPGTDTLIS